MDPINPITPGAPPLSARLAVQPLRRITREQDRPSPEEQRRRRRQASERPDEDIDEPDDDGRPHIDVRA
jgi:hypothetical protein